MIVSDENLPATELESLRRVCRRAQNLVNSLRAGPDEYPPNLETEQAREWSKLDDALKTYAERFLSDA